MSAPAGSPHPAAGARMPPKLGGAVSGLAPPQQNGEARDRGAARGLGRPEGEGESEGGRAGGRPAPWLGAGRAGPGRPRWGPEAAVKHGGRGAARGAAERTAGRGCRRSAIQACHSAWTEAVA